MDDRTKVRLSGAAAITGGVLRVANSFTADAFDGHTLQIVYFVTDVMLLFGLLGVYLSKRDALGWSGLFGFVIGVVGVLIIRSSALFGARGYMIGATVLLIGLAILSAAMLARSGLPKLAPMFWLTSLAFGIASGIAPGLVWLTTLAGVSFGLGFVLAGWTLVRIEQR